MGRVEGKVAIVTGGASGIGRGCALRLAEEGARVAITDIQDEAGEKLAAEIGSEAAVYLQHDVTQEPAWIDIVARVVERFGRLDILVNNAGIGLWGPITEFSLEDWQRQNAVNLDGVFLGTKHSIAPMREGGGGSIINMSSVAGLQGAPNFAAYCATKGGVRLFTKAVALECARDGIRVNSVHPGVIDTPIWGKANTADVTLPAGEAASPDPKAIAALLVPSGEVGYPKDVADGVVFLASEESRYMTGAELVIDAGISAG